MKAQEVLVQSELYFWLVQELLVQSKLYFSCLLQCRSFPALSPVSRRLCSPREGRLVQQGGRARSGQLLSCCLKIRVKLSAGSTVSARGATQRERRKQPLIDSCSLRLRGYEPQEAQPPNRRCSTQRSPRQPAPRQTANSPPPQGCSR